MTLGEKIKIGRKKNNLSKEDFAGILNISLDTVDSIENDEFIPETNKLKEISNVLEISLDYLLKDNVKTSKIENLTEENRVPEDKKEEKQINVPKSVEKVNHNSIIHEKRIKENKYNVIRIWMIIGTVLTPLVLGSSMIGLGPYSVICLAFYGITIPLCVYVLRILKSARSRNDLIEWGILSLFLISIVGGILILILKDEDFEILTEELKLQEINKQKEIERKKKEKENQKELEKQREAERINKIREEEIKRTILEEEQKELRRQKYIKELQDAGYHEINEAFRKTKKAKVDDSKKQDAYKELKILKEKCKEIKSHDDLKSFKKDVKNVIPKKRLKKKQKVAILITVSTIIIPIAGTTGGLYFYTDINYKNVLNNISTYKSEKNETIENSLNKVIFNYKKSSKIKSEFKVVKECSQNIYAYISNNWYVSINNDVALKNRESLYKMANCVYYNSSEEWNLNYYFEDICLPRFINNATLSNGSDYLKWTYDDGKNNLTTSISFLSGSSSIKYKVTYDTGSNKLLCNPEYGNYSFSSFDISNLTFDKTTKEFKVDIYFYYNKTTKSFTIKI